jgi:uncharacterized iron-regulated protein
MKNLIKVIIFVICFNTNFLTTMSAKEAFKIYDNKGKELKYKKVVSKLFDSEIILFGELHNNPISHFLQIKFLKEIYNHDPKLTIGAEMFEADNQIVIDELLSGKIRLKDFENEARLWNNYKTDYSFFVNFALKNKVNLIATNIPRRYASLLAREGEKSLFDLDELAKKYICPLPMEYDEELEGYKSMAGMGANHGMPYIAQSQAIKDATMAYFIHKNFYNRFYHLNGTYHSNNYEGIYWYLKKLNPDYRILTIASVEQDDIEKLNEDNKGLADIIIVIDSDMTKSY